MDARIRSRTRTYALQLQLRKKNDKSFSHIYVLVNVKMMFINTLVGREFFIILGTQKLVIQHVGSIKFTIHLGRKLVIREKRQSLISHEIMHQSVYAI